VANGREAFLAFGDIHFPEQDNEALEVFLKVVRKVKPKTAVCLGDMLDCKAFSTHPPDNQGDSPLAQEVKLAVGFLDRLQKNCGKLIFLEGNHEYRIYRHAARDRAGAAALDMVSPRKLLGSGRSKRTFQYIPYGTHDGFYFLTDSLVCVHGWSAAKDAAARHLRLARPKSVIFGHTHRADSCVVRQLWSDHNVFAMSAGCLCNLHPSYGSGSPNDWAHGFVYGHVSPNGRASATFVSIEEASCILPDGSEIKC
jgi:predicted phosphodiesterase